MSVYLGALTGYGSRIAALLTKNGLELIDRLVQLSNSDIIPI